VTEPRRILIDWEYGASGLCWCSTKEEYEASSYSQWSHLTSVQQPGGPPIHSAMPELTRELRADLQAWNDSWDERNPRYEEIAQALREQGRELAVRVQNELGTDGWEVLYKLDGRVHRVRPPGRWPVRTWMEELLGYTPRDRLRAEEQVRHHQKLRDMQDAVEAGSAD
jgi:hypothetical protein